MAPFPETTVLPADPVSPVSRSADDPCRCQSTEANWSVTQCHGYLSASSQRSHQAQDQHQDERDADNPNPDAGFEDGFDRFASEEHRARSGNRWKGPPCRVCRH
jgi:hypothetical protein